MEHLNNPDFAEPSDYKVSSREIEYIISGLEITPSGNLVSPDTNAINTAAVQMQLRSYASLTEYIADMNMYISDAVNRRCQIICLPAFVGLLPATFLPGAFEILNNITLPPDNALPDMEALQNGLAQYADNLFDIYIQTVSRLAEMHQVYIMAGSTLCFDEGVLRHRAFLINQSGELVGMQDKLSLTAFEVGLSVDPAYEIKVFDTPVGPLSILIGSDASYFETVRVARALGAKIILNPTCIHGEISPVDLSDGLNLRIQENNLYGVQSGLVGNTGFGLSLRGVGVIYSPTALVNSAKNGKVVQTTGKLRPEIVSARLNLDILDTLIEPYMGDNNSRLMDKYIDRLY